MFHQERMVEKKIRKNNVIITLNVFHAKKEKKASSLCFKT